jgi:hypothetical protein
VDFVDSDVSADRYGGSVVSDDARSEVAQHANVIGDCIHGAKLPFVVWMMRGFFRELPRELEEAAMVDGDSRLGALVRVILPLVTPGLAATAVFCLIVSWNEIFAGACINADGCRNDAPGGDCGKGHSVRDQMGRDERGRCSSYDSDFGICNGSSAIPC